MTAFRATFSDVKNIKTRQVVQLVFEVPLADFDAAYEVLGGLPDPSKERWFGIAALKQETEVMPPAQQSTAEIRPQPPVSPAVGAKRDWRDLQPQQQAGIRCGEPLFRAFLKEARKDDWSESADDAAACVRLICGVESRAMMASTRKPA